MPKQQQPLLLDTHVWVWLVLGERPLAPACIERIEMAASAGRLWVAAISVWEVGMLEAKNRLRLGVDCLAWTTQALALPGLSLAPLTPEIAIESSRLPGEFHGDPADRIITASARALRAVLVTSDESILKYAEMGFVTAMKAVGE